MQSSHKVITKQKPMQVRALNDLPLQYRGFNISEKYTEVKFVLTTSKEDIECRSTRLLRMTGRGRRMRYDYHYAPLSLLLSNFLIRSTTFQCWKYFKKTHRTLINCLYLDNVCHLHYLTSVFLKIFYFNRHILWTFLQKMSEMKDIQEGDFK